MTLIKQLSVKIIVYGIILSLIGIPVIPVQAGSTSTEDAYKPDMRWINTNSILMGMAFSGNTASCEIELVGMEGTTHISAVVKLYRRNVNGTLTYITTFPTATSNCLYLFFSDSCTDTRICPVNVYLLTIDAKVTRNGVVENVYEELEKVYY